jgi:16S rRNA C1402 (ribose-2'-O) methylase RsmI
MKNLRKINLKVKHFPPFRQLVNQILNLLLEEMPLKRAAALAAQITGERKNVLYQVALDKQKGE